MPRMLAGLGARLRAHPPRAVVTCARGSSDHAATYARYLIEAHTPALTSSAAPSLSSIYDASTDLRDVLFIAISQSGKSPDLLAATDNARARGALTVALCNTPDAPLMQRVDVAVSLHAGPRIQRRRDQVVHRLAELHRAAGRELDAGPGAVRGAGATAGATRARLGMRLDRGAWPRSPMPSTCSWSARGFGLGVAQEAALKLKETCGLHAEAFSSAEVKHGPMALVRAGFPVLMFSQDDETRAGIEQLAAEFAARGARVLLAGARAHGATMLPARGRRIRSWNPCSLIQSFYRMANDLSLARGLIPTARHTSTR